MTDSVRLTRQIQTASTTTAEDREVRLLGWLAGIGIGSAILIMIGAALVRQDWMTTPIAMPATGPPFELHAHVSGEVASLALWLAALLALGGVIAGLLAARRGAHGPIRLILVAAAVTVLVLAVLPPAGSTDALDYAAYGRLTLLGDNPYVATPLYLRLTDPVFGASIPAHWQHQVSLYGPAATIEQYFAAKLGGNSMARVVFWLKFWNAIAFGVVAVALDRVLRFRPSARLRAHLLWTINPLLLWDLVAAGHVDAAAAAAGILGVLALGRQPAADGLQPRIWRAVAAGVLVGLAADIKIDYLLFAAALAWALRRSAPALIAASAGALVVLAPTYAWLGKPAILGLFARTDQTTQDSFYRSVELTGWKYLVVLAALLFIAMAALLLRRLPPGDLRRPALRPAIALSLAWLIVWPYQLPWYDAMIICVLVLYPASRLDWLVLVRLCAATIANMPGNVGGVPVRSLKGLDALLVHGLAPAVLLGAAMAVVLLAVFGAWGVQQETSPALPLAPLLSTMSDRGPGEPERAVAGGAADHPAGAGQLARRRRE
ncbi:MAG TPA: hypothetical protein VMA73_27520 [Streptosporangiaceae bacterium]|nr:hypothetical protein [Streptosporangiaceae bacterium]